MKLDKESALTEINFGNVYGRCVSLIGEVGENTRIYEIKPNIYGNYGLPMRVMTTMFMSVGSFYSIRGYLDTTYLDKLLVPVLSVTRITEIDRRNIKEPIANDIIKSVKASSFVVVNNLKVISKVPNGKNFIVTLSKETYNNKHFMKLDFVALTTPHCFEDAQKLKVGDTINILGTIHRDRKYEGKNYGKEIGVKILKLNIDNCEIQELQNSLTELHKKVKNIG